MKIIVPAYFYPGLIWDALLESDPSVVRDVIINPASGPGSVVDAQYLEVVRRCKKNGFGVLGYVATGYAAKHVRAVKEEIQRYWDWYAPTGIFLDEVAAERDVVDYYRNLYGFIQGKVVLNHGTVPPEEYFDAGDVLVVFESVVGVHSKIQFPVWLKKHRSESCQIVVACGAAGKTPLRRLYEMGKVLKKCAATSEYVYITDDEMPNPYDVLPSYWKELVKECVKTKR